MVWSKEGAEGGHNVFIPMRKSCVFVHSSTPASAHLTKSFLDIRVFSNSVHVFCNLSFFFFFVFCRLLKASTSTIESDVRELLIDVCVNISNIQTHQDRLKKVIWASFISNVYWYFLSITVLPVFSRLWWDAETTSRLSLKPRMRLWLPEKVNKRK